MKKSIQGVVAAICLLVVSAASAAKPGDRASNFSLKDMEGKAVSLKALRGKVVLLDFWASWCVPCKKELPKLDQLSKHYTGKDVVILAVNIDKDRNNAKKFLSKAKVKHLQVLLDPKGTTPNHYDLPTMPTSFVIDKKGIIRFVHSGYKPGDEKKFVKEINSLL